jgi:hypothetical protein
VADDIQLPVYVLAKDCGGFTEYSSLADMRAYLEAIDVEGNEYHVWDAEGFVVTLISANKKPDWLRLERTDAQLSEARLIEIKSPAIPYVHGLRANS